jgi:hippurate hydrolase
MNTRSTQADEQIAAVIEELLPELETFYKDVHAHPELSMQETRTRH